MRYNEDGVNNLVWLAICCLAAVAILTISGG